MRYPEPKCPRCSHGICSVERIVEGRTHSFAFRCSCPAGDEYPGFLLVPAHERTIKEGRQAPDPILTDEIPF